MNDHEMDILKNNYNQLVLLDDSEIIKKYGKKFEDLCMVRDASSLKEDIYPGYYVCEATVVTQNEKQPSHYIVISIQLKVTDLNQ